jgi:hypothetical protein
VNNVSGAYPARAGDPQHILTTMEDDNL